MDIYTNSGNGTTTETYKLQLPAGNDTETTTTYNDTETAIEKTAADNRKWYEDLIPDKNCFAAIVIAAINIAVYILMLIRGADFIAPDIEMMIDWGANIRLLTLDGEPQRLFTAMFLHYGFIHLLLNMSALITIGRQLERVIGPVNFTVFYVLTGVCASIASTVWNVNSPSVGASGAIFGMEGLFIGILLSGSVHIENKRAILAGAAAVVCYGLFGGLIMDMIDNAAHIGGLISGIIIGLLGGSYLVPGQNRKISAVVVLVASVVVAGVCWMGLSMTTNSMKIYEEQMKIFEVREKEALAVIRTATDSKEEMIYQLNDRGIYYWQENIELVKKMQGLPLPDAVEEYNDKLIQYCNLRIESYKLYSKAIDEETEKYSGELQQLNNQIETMMKSLR